MSEAGRCAKCKKESPSLYGNPKQFDKLTVPSEVEGAAKPEYLCFECLDEIAPEYVNKYPGWRERERVKRQRTEIARKNFGHADTGTQKEMF